MSVKEALKSNDKELVIVRYFDASREQLWKAWTDIESMRRWFGPKGFTVPVCKIDLRIGGGFHLSMRSPEGKDYWVKGIYREIKPPERLIYSDYFSDKDANIVSPVEYGMSPEFPMESLVKITIEKQNNKTVMTVQFVSPRGKERDMAEAGWNESFDKLEDALAGR